MLSSFAAGILCLVLVFCNDTFAVSDDEISEILRFDQA